MAGEHHSTRTQRVRRPLVSLVVPAFNEEAILRPNLNILCDYMRTLESQFEWELLLVNDGSSDTTLEIAHQVAEEEPRMRVLSHFTNFGLGQVFQYAFKQSRGDYVVTVDVDLSYAPEHIGRLLEEIVRTRAKIVLASPYMEGGQISNVPWLRRTLSIAANHFLSHLAGGNLSTLTCMVRAYDGRFLRSLPLKASGMDIMPETIYKAKVLGALIRQVPAHLDWSLQRQAASRTSSMRIVAHVFSTVLSGFIFRPIYFFILPGLLLFALSCYTNVWGFVHILDALFPGEGVAIPTFSRAVGIAFAQHPHTFVVGLLSLTLAVQLISLGLLALQNKRYFEEVFHLSTSIRRLELEKQQPQQANTT